jgi:hypothetical protein
MEEEPAELARFGIELTWPAKSCRAPLGPNTWLVVGNPVVWEVNLLAAAALVETCPGPKMVFGLDDGDGYAAPFTWLAKILCVNITGVGLIAPPLLGSRPRDMWGWPFSARPVSWGDFGNTREIRSPGTGLISQGICF